jgi:hypothetical protein
MITVVCEKNSYLFTKKGKAHFGDPLWGTFGSSIIIYIH